MTSHTAVAPPQENTNSTLDMPSLVQAGTACLEKGDLRGALEAFEGVVTAFPDRPEGHNNLGALYTSLGEFAKAEASFDHVISLLPDNPGLYYNRGMARSNQEKFDLAREDFLKVLEFDPRDTDCLNNLGVMDFMQGRFDQARERFQQAMDIRPDYDRALLNMCDVEIATGNGPRAVNLCEEYLQRYSSVDVKRALLEMLSTGCRDALEKAGRTAQSILNTGVDDPDLTQRLDRIQKAKAVLEDMGGM
jgi:Flp pilus assembly protein TadD